MEREETRGGLNPPLLLPDKFYSQVLLPARRHGPRATGHCQASQGQLHIPNQGDMNLLDLPAHSHTAKLCASSALPLQTPRRGKRNKWCHHPRL